MELFIFIIACYGASNIVVFGAIFESLQDHFASKADKSVVCNWISILIGCMMCISFWFGVLLSVIYYSPAGPEPWALWVNGCLASGSTWLLYSWQDYLMRG